VAIVIFHDPFDNGEPDAGTIEFVLAMKLLKYLKYFFTVLLFEPMPLSDTVIWR
jgi:hypothetical protein